MTSCQEPESYQEIQPENQEHGISSGTTILPPPTTTAATTTTITSEAPVWPLERCNSCGSLKRRSTSSLSSSQERCSKRASLHPPATATATGATSSVGNHHFSSKGSQELPVTNITSPAAPPPSSSNAKQTFLNRSISDITSYMGTQETGESDNNVLGSFSFLFQPLNSQSPQSSKNNVVSATPSPAAGSLAPLPPILPRSLSDPTGPDFQAEATTMPPRPPAARNFSSSPSYGRESTNSKRLRRMKERMKEMSQLMDEFVPAEDKDEHTCPGSDDAIDKNSKDIPQNDSHTEHEEAVWAERTGEGLVLHFKCPCGKGYEIFLSGKKCYYRLM